MTQEEKMGCCAPRRIKEARTAGELCHDVGAPAVGSFMAMIRGNMIENCPVTVEDVDQAEETGQVPNQ